jgi:hypothetical protein
MIRLNQMKSIIWERGEVTFLELQNLMKPKLSIQQYNSLKPYLQAMFKDSVEYDKPSKIWRFIYPATPILQDGQTQLESSTNQ